MTKNFVGATLSMIEKNYYEKWILWFPQRRYGKSLTCSECDKKPNKITKKAW